MDFVVLSWIDYVLFIAIFAASTIIGIYFGYYEKQDTLVDYLLGGNKMRVFPTAMSLVGSFVSGVTVLGYPAEIYMHGTQYSMANISTIFAGIIINYIYLPVFYKLHSVSIFEYLELRFDKTIRIIASVLFTFCNLLFAPVVIYGPALAFNHVTGINLHLIAMIMSLICIFYTTIGGVKAVVWTDTLQILIILATLGFILVLGLLSVGGISAVWEKAKLGSRLEFFNMDPDPTIRSTFWSVFLGNIFVYTFHIGAQPATVQRFQSVPTLSDSRKVLLLVIIFSTILKSISCFAGLLAYARYHDCDPLSARHISKPDEIFPYYVVDVAGTIPGISGLFFAGLFSAALSTLSTQLNTLSGTIYVDFIAPVMPLGTSEKRASTIVKVLCILTGTISIALTFVVEKLGTILQATFSILGVTTGPLLGVFTLGMLFPRSNKHGALSGLIASLLLLLVIAITNHVYIWNGTIKPTSKPLYTYNCNFTSNFSGVFELTTLPTINNTLEEPLWLARISFHYYILIGTLATIIIGLPISLITSDERDGLVKRDLLSPCIHRFVVKSDVTASYESVDNK